MDCVIVAGGRLTTEDPLYPYTWGKPKALLDIAGRAMLDYVLAALQSAQHIENVIVVGLDEGDGAELQPARPLIFLQDEGSIVKNIRAGIAWLQIHCPGSEEVLLSTGDIPLITGAIVDSFVESCQPFDHLVYYNVVKRETMERSFPNSNRTFVKLKGLEVAGGDLVLAQKRIADTNQQLWEALTDARKHPWRLARIVGASTLLKLLLRQLSLDEAQQAADRMLGATVKVLISPYPEVAMDVDNPYQVEYLRRKLT